MGRMKLRKADKLMLIPCNNTECHRMIRTGRSASAHKLCPVCRRARQKKIEQDRQARRNAQPKTQRLHRELLGNLPQREVARILRTTEKNIWRIERAALDKLRKDKQAISVLREYWAAYLESGVRPAQRLSPAEELLEYQLQVSDFYKKYDWLVGEGMTEEALECLALIKQCQRLIRREIGLEEKS